MVSSFETSFPAYVSPVHYASNDPTEDSDYSSNGRLDRVETVREEDGSPSDDCSTPPSVTAGHNMCTISEQTEPEGESERCDPANDSPQKRAPRPHSLPIGNLLAAANRNLSLSYAAAPPASDRSNFTAAHETHL